MSECENCKTLAAKIEQLIDRMASGVIRLDKSGWVYDKHAEFDMRRCPELRDTFDAALRAALEAQDEKPV